MGHELSHLIARRDLPSSDFLETVAEPKIRNFASPVGRRHALLTVPKLVWSEIGKSVIRCLAAL